MTRIHFRFLVVGVAVLAAAAAAAAQTPVAPVLNQVEVRLLVARAEPGDHATLSSHFAALADRYASDARRHNAMAQASGGNPNRANHSTSAHCTRLAELNEQAAATLRDLANHHERLASGIPSFVPRDAARFEEGEGAPEPTERQLAELSVTTGTATDHRALEEYFATRANRYAADAIEHTAMAQAYRANANRRGGDPAVHCDRMIKLSRKAAADARAAAEEHRAMATVR